VKDEDKKRLVDCFLAILFVALFLLLLVWV